MLADRPGLATVVADGLAERHGPCSIERIERSRFERSSSYDAEVLTVHLSGRRPVRLFLKDFGAYGYVKDHMTERRHREHCVYRDLLPRADLGTPRYYGAVWDEPAGRFWLLLEFVEGPPVRYCEFPEWVSAAAWLGRMQAHFAGRVAELQASDFLERHDSRFFLSMAEAALQAVEAISSPLHRRLAAAVGRYDEAVDGMAAQANTLSHGGFRPQNIVSSTECAGRICPIDWEEAALGAPLYDFAYISEGFEGDRLRRLMDAYLEEAARHGLASPSDDIWRSLHCFHLHKALNTLAKAYERRFPLEGVEKLVGMAEASAGRAL